MIRNGTKIIGFLDSLYCSLDKQGSAQLMIDRRKKKTRLEEASHEFHVVALLSRATGQGQESSCAQKFGSDQSCGCSSGDRSSGACDDQTSGSNPNTQGLGGGQDHAEADHSQAKDNDRLHL